MLVLHDYSFFFSFIWLENLRVNFRNMEVMLLDGRHSEYSFTSPIFCFFFLSPCECCGIGNDWKCNSIIQILRFYDYIIKNNNTVIN